MVVEVRMNPSGSGPPGETGGCMIWAVRIAVTLFVVPFFVVGFGMLFAGQHFGGLGGFGALFGLPFIAIPALMLVAVWTAKPMAHVRGVTGLVTTPEAERRRCEYCGRQREVREVACPSCGAD